MNSSFLLNSCWVRQYIRIWAILFAQRDNQHLLMATNWGRFRLLTACARIHRIENDAKAPVPRSPNLGLIFSIGATKDEANRTGSKPLAHPGHKPCDLRLSLLSPRLKPWERNPFLAPLENRLMPTAKWTGPCCLRSDDKHLAEQYGFCGLYSFYWSIGNAWGLDVNNLAAFSSEHRGFFFECYTVKPIKLSKHPIKQVIQRKKHA